MQSFNCRWCARTVRILVAGLSVALATPSFAEPPQNDADGVVAYIDHIIRLMPGLPISPPLRGRTGRTLSTG
jgi:hypothetical protein